MTQINIIAVPFHDWKKGQTEGFRTRDNHLLQEFRNHPDINKLIILDRPISLTEMILKGRSWRVRSDFPSFRKGLSNLSQLDERTHVIDIMSLDVIRPVIQRRKWLPKAYGSRTTTQAIKNALSYLDIHEFILLLFSPLPMPLYWNLSQPLLVVDAVDNLLKIPQFFNMKDEVKTYYDQIRMQAKVIFTNSRENQEFLSDEYHQAIYIPNGVNFHHFKAKSDLIPRDLQKLPKPIIGYAGKMQELFDVDLLIKIAEYFPNVSFVCIGQVLNSNWMKRLWKIPNVYYLGDKHYDILPDYITNFDICMIPYNIERHHNNDPIKFYEYLSLGKPVITTKIGGVNQYQELPQVRIVENSEDFIQSIKDFLDLISNNIKLPEIHLPADVLWSTKANMMIQTITQVSV